jgi:hypothetical protein
VTTNNEAAPKSGPAIACQNRLCQRGRGPMSITIPSYQRAVTLDDVKAVTIPEVAAKLFREWKPAKSCRSPFRPDRSASFSVFDEGRRWRDFAEAASGDVVDFVTRALGCSFEEPFNTLAVV